jgi:hypothetical protein
MEILFSFVDLLIMKYLKIFVCHEDRLCGLVVRVPGYRSRSPGSILGATRFSEMYWVWNRVYSAS